MTDKIQYAGGRYHAGDDIIDHNSHAAVHAAIKPHRMGRGFQYYPECGK